MDIEIVKASAASVHAQLTEQLKYHVEVGTWLPGQKLPTVRELSGALRLNYNTVRAAYQELEREGYVVTEQGRGTFVSEHAPRLPAGRAEDETVLDLIDEALARAQAEGVDADAFVRLAAGRARLLASGASAVRMLLVECNRPGLARYGRQVERSVGVRPDLLLVDELRQQPPDALAAYDVLATTLFHIEEVRAILDEKRREAGAWRGGDVLGLMIEPSYFDVVREIAQLPAGTGIGLVCTSRADAETMVRSLLGVGAGHLRLLAAGADEPARLQDVFGEAERVYISLQGLEAHRGDWPPGAAVHPYRDDISAAALRLLRRRVGRLRAGLAS